MLPEAFHQVSAPDIIYGLEDDVEELQDGPLVHG